MNPIFAREWQARWRDKRSFLLLFALIALLSVVASWTYVSALSDVHSQVQYPTNYINSWSGTRNPVEPMAGRIARVGRALFQVLSLGNCLSCLFLAPALAAPGIARERERGLLESLQLSQMTPRSQILARYFSNVVYLLALQAATLPIYGTILLLGRVSPQDIAFTSLLVVVSILWGTALGLWLSARSYRPSSALFGALGGLLVWSLFSWGLSTNSIMPYIAFSRTQNTIFYLSALNPVILQQLYINPQSLIGYRLPPPVALTLVEQAKQAVLVSLCFYLVTGALMVISAIRRVNVSMPPAEWQGRNRWIEKRKAQLTARRVEAQKRRERAQLSEQVQGALMADLPVDKLVRFQDPLLSREVKGRFRLRKASIGISLLRFAGFVVGASTWLLTSFVLFDPKGELSSQNNTAQTLIYILWGLGVASVCALSATSLAREKESGTWEGLRLSLLRPGEIVRSKWLSILISFAYYSAPLWLLLPFAFLRGATSASTILMVMIALASMGAFCAFGLWVSWRSPSPTAALTWTLGLAFAFLVALPQFESVADVERQLSFGIYGVSPASASYRWQGQDDAREQNNWIQEQLDLGNTYVNVPGSLDSTGFYMWRMKRQRQAGNLWMWLHIWQPRTMFTLLQSPLYLNRTSWAYNNSIATPEAPLTHSTIWFHLCLTCGACVAFLALLHRDILRHQE